MIQIVFLKKTKKVRKVIISSLKIIIALFDSLTKYARGGKCLFGLHMVMQNKHNLVILL